MRLEIGESDEGDGSGRKKVAGGVIVFVYNRPNCCRSTDERQANKTTADGVTSIWVEGSHCVRAMYRGARARERRVDVEEVVTP